ncbi:glycosyltransferase family 2 protein [Bacillus cytotoxicus]|uniref:Glycosyl transferase family 2 n=2 Tax=Bacillus cytotoxicus TaxID=580165 RepID=A0AAX2CGP8_9BACI|nr:MULTISPECIES: glycosyltransferase [Bacillus cereus group]ABS22109.1 glycosyl transferase family 2 [Bacillus cytotoxicus NVH 391-98]AWC28716.1 glycosyl transferase [Bacillus cytotoxicus]AWC32733.1 glycosyl transferase [Bacillus cytotoxicus]AWC36761.1 glycosyl transferase [Bacillus cytotoxicus]AWC39902.1 glycosyl transferase [Bacillus cytotoxicus]
MQKKSISIILPVFNEEKTLDRVLQAALQIHPLEIIVVANGCTDRSVEIAHKYKCHVLNFEAALGHNIGRAIGAQQAKGDILLFMDADFPLDSNILREFLQPLMNHTADVVLNNLDYIFYKKQRPHSTTIWRQVTNQFFHRPDLKIDSPISVPHAMTKEVVHTIGAESLGNPTLAHLKIIQHNFRISRHKQIDVISINRVNPQQHFAKHNELSTSEKRIIGNHIAAMAEWIDELKNPRAHYSDGGRRRDIVEGLKLKQSKSFPKVHYTGWGVNTSNYGGKQLSIIIPVQNEEKMIQAIIQESRKLNPLEIIVVVNGTTDKTAEIAKKHGATIVMYEEELGNDTGRAIGAYFARGDILLFIDGDFVIPSNDLLPFVHAVENGVDLALNDLDHYLSYRFPLYIVTACKYAVNLACDRKDLGVGSIVAVPHAFSKKCIETIGFDALTSPVYGQVKAILSGLQVKNVHRVDVDKMNRIRPDKHFSKTGGLAPSTTRIVGDHIEAISYLIQQKGERGLF